MNSLGLFRMKNLNVVEDPAGIEIYADGVESVPFTRSGGEPDLIAPYDGR